MMFLTCVLAGALIAFALWSFIEAASSIAQAMLIIDGRHSEVAGQSADGAIGSSLWWAILSVAAAFSAGVIL